jgi:hypothetical protein
VALDTGIAAAGALFSGVADAAGSAAEIASDAAGFSAKTTTLVRAAFKLGDTAAQIGLAYADQAALNDGRVQQPWMLALPVLSAAIGAGVSGPEDLSVKRLAISSEDDLFNLNGPASRVRTQRQFDAFVAGQRRLAVDPLSGHLRPVDPSNAYAPVSVDDDLADVSLAVASGTKRPAVQLGSSPEDFSGKIDVDVAQFKSARVNAEPNPIERSGGLTEELPSLWDDGPQWTNIQKILSEGKQAGLAGEKSASPVLKLLGGGGPEARSAPPVDDPLLVDADLLSDAEWLQRRKARFEGQEELDDPPSPDYIPSPPGWRGIRAKNEFEHSLQTYVVRELAENGGVPVSFLPEQNYGQPLVRGLLDNLRYKYEDLLGDQYYQAFEIIQKRILDNGGVQNTFPNGPEFEDSRQAAANLLPGFLYSLPDPTNGVPINPADFHDVIGDPDYKAAYKVLNAKLRSGDPVQVQSVEAIQRELETSIKLLPKYRGTVYRGVDDTIPADVVAQWKTGNIVTDPAFVSTSMKPGVPLKFKPVTIFVDDTYSGRDLQLASAFGEVEAEVLFPPNTKWQVLKVVEGENLEYMGKPVQRIIYRREIPAEANMVLQAPVKPVRRFGFW